MNRLTLILATLVLAIQWPLWFGHGGWIRVWDLQRQLVARQDVNAGLRARNQTLTAEIASLRLGSEAIEERARGELHMIRPEEVFFQFPPGAAAAGGAAAGTGEAASGQALHFGVE